MAGIIPRTFIDTLLDRVDVVDVVDSRVKLKKSGKNYSACCPFHDEKTPSFTVSPDKQFYYCFGCGASGNALGFIMDYERLSFPEAVESLAKSAGLDVPREQADDPKSREREKAREQARQNLYTVMEASGEFFIEQLKSHGQKSRAVDYLKRRGLTGQVAKNFGIGYAPPGWDNLVNAVGTSNAKQDSLLEAGMLIFNEDKERLYDRFRDRVVFPIRDSRGRVIAFGGRVLTDEKPKYLNSPETPIFHKGQELYGLYEARQAYRQLPRLLVVEGYMDVVALAQYGIAYGVATLGTACSTEHLQRGFRFTNEIVFCFDGDEAGRKAARRAMENALPAMEDGRQVKFLYLPEGEDPDTLVRQIGAEKFTRLIESAVPLENFMFDELSQGFNPETMEGKARLCKLAAPLLDQLPQGVYRELMFNQLASRSQLSVDALKQLIEELPTAAKPADDYPQTVSTNNEGTSLNKAPDKSVNYHSPAQPLLTQQKIVSALKLPADERAISLLLFQPSLATLIDDLEDLKESRDDNIELLAQLIEFLQQRPNFSGGQLLGHWQGSYGLEASEKIKQFLAQGMVFYQARQLMEKKDHNHFNAEDEFVDVVQHLVEQVKRSSCDDIIRQLNAKPPSQWTEAEKSLYLKALQSNSNKY